MESCLDQVTKIALVAGEASGDALGEGLIQQLKIRYPNAEFIGIGGPKMISQGLQSWYPMESLSVMGFFEVLKHLRSLLKLRKSLIERLLNASPDMFIGIDAPDFNFEVESRLKAARIPVFHYVGPSVWAWREKRLEKIKQQVDGVLVLFPFEPEIYHKYDIPVAFVGHPAANKMPEKPDSEVAKKSLNLPLNVPLTGILPGSRMSEVSQMLPLYLQTIERLSQRYLDMVFVIPCVNEKIKQRVVDLRSEMKLNHLPIHLVDQQSNLVMQACDQLLITSGTATLEADLSKTPMVIAIKVHPISYWIMKRLATTKWVGLPNILEQSQVVSELIQKDVTVDNLFSEMINVIEDSSTRAAQISAFDRHYIALKQNASERAVTAITKWYQSF